MSLEKWELLYHSSDRDKNRWLLKVRIDERELMPLINVIPGTLGRPFLLKDGDFTFGFYLYEVTETELGQLKKVLEERCPDGKIVGPGREESLDRLLEKVAQSIDDTSVKTSDEPSRAVKEHDTPEERPRQPADTVKKEHDTSDDQEPRIRLSAGAAKEGTSSVSSGFYDFQDMDLNERYVFPEFIIGPNNRFTAAAAQAVADNPGKVYNPFFIYGGVGLGKTHLMHAVGHSVHAKRPELRIMYVTTEKFMSEVIDSIRRGSLQQMRDHYRQVDLLLVDDIQFLVESESTQEEFFHTFNVLHQNGKQIIITSDRPPKQLTTLEDRLRSRFEWGLIADIKSPNLETRVAILKKKEELEHLNLDDNILLYIASKLKSNIRELEGFLKRINAYASLTQQDVNIDLVKTLMSDLLPAEELDDPAPPDPTKVQSKYARTNVNAAPVAPVQNIPRETIVPAKPPEPAPLPVQETPPSPPPVFQPPVQPVTPPPPPVAPPPPPKAAPDIPSYAMPVDGAEAGLKPVEVAFFYPEGCDAELAKVKDRFRDVIKKHKLKFRLEGVFERSYMLTGKINYAFFTELCKTNSVSIAVVLGPSPESMVSPDDFSNLLSTMMDDEHISLQLVPWTEINKDYRYLNLALDITLLKHGS